MTLEEDKKDAENQMFLLQDHLMTLDVAGHALREAGQERLATLVFTTVLNLQGMVVVMERIIARIDQEISAERESRQK